VIPTIVNGKEMSGKEVFYPPSDIAENAFLKDYEGVYRESIADPEGFWDKAAKELEWFSTWSKVLDWRYPRARWFVDARCNVVHNALDRHVRTWRRNKVAMYWEGEPGEKKVITYGELYRLVNKLANALKKLGVRKGDFVAIFLPIVPEQVISMLACAKIGAIHNVIYYGYSARILRERIMETGSKVLITSNAAYSGGRLTAVANTIAQLSQCPSLKYVVIKKRVDIPIIMEQYRPTHVREEPKYLDWDDLLNGAPDICECEVMTSEDPLFIIYTSGTAGRPKGIIHSHGGYMVGSYLTTKLVFDLRDNDVYWCTASPGWITGHTYVVYGPLINGASILIYEGDLSYPSPGRWAKIIDEYYVSIFYTIPTYIRGFMFEEDAIKRYSLGSLRILGTVGEPIDPLTWRWFHKYVGRGRCPVIDTWWQTETGIILITGFPSIPLKPGSVGRPFPTVVASVITPAGKVLENGEEGLLAVRGPWPGLMETVYQDPRKYIDYWDLVEGWYVTGDVASVDKDGYFWIKGRSDDVIKIAGYRIGTAEIEKAILSHPGVVDVAAVGKPSPSGGEVVKLFVVLREGWSLDDELVDEIKRRVADYIGPIAVPSEVEAINSLPRTRSGKILRRFLRERELGRTAFGYDG